MPQVDELSYFQREQVELQPIDKVDTSWIRYCMHLK
jgi:hypothetical protein